MHESTYERVRKLCGNSRVRIADEQLGIGRELSYEDNPERTIVVHFLETEYPEIIFSTLETIIGVEPHWFLLNRYGKAEVAEFKGSETINIAKYVIAEWQKVQEGADFYLIGNSGQLFLSKDHHVYNDGMAIYLSDVAKTDKLLSKLNYVGAEFEVFAKNG